jgi:AraC-like DNA-binding protein
VGRPFEKLQAQIHEGVVIVLDAPIAALIDRAEQLTARSFSGSLVSQMVDRVDLRAPTGEAFARTLKTAFVEFGALNSAGLGPLAMAGYEDLLTSLAAAVLFPPVTRGLGRSPAQCGPAQIRRARDFIKTNAAEPIKMSEVAADLGVPMRTLQESFRKWFGLSPRAWLLECQLVSARQRLVSPDHAASVSRVAFECGFGDLSQFSAKYHARYGELPSDTLAIARRHGS